MLRDYQIEICERVREAFARHRSVMMQMPTGTGKTVVLAELVRRPPCPPVGGEGCAKVLIVAHRRELIEQIKETIKRIVAPPPPGGGIVVESIQTISRRIGNPPTGGWGGFSLVIIDEAHHAVAKTYRMLWDAWPEARFLGLTATPYRLSGEGFTDLFEVMVESWSVKRFIAEGWLSAFDYYSIQPESDEQKLIDGLRKRGADGDFQMKEMHETLDVAPCIERLFESFERFAYDKKGIVYAIDIEHAEHIAEYYREQGVNAMAISSKTPKEERKKIIERFKAPLPPGGGCCHADALTPHRGAGGPCVWAVLVSVDLFSEGFDCPDVEFIQMARPTLSLAKYLQMVGRGLRAHEGKESCTIIDNVGLYRRFGLPSGDRDWGRYFEGLKNLNLDLNLDLDLNLNLDLNNGDVREERGADLVKIIGHEGMATRFEKIGKEGFERKRKDVLLSGKRKKVWIWVDTLTGITFERHPVVVDFKGVEMMTDDGLAFYPRIRSKWVDEKSAINRKALETQVGDGFGWMKKYVSLCEPDKVYELQEVMGNGMRVYKDEEGKTFFQQDLDCPLVSKEEAGGKKAFMALCDKRLEDWKAKVLERRREGWAPLPPGGGCSQSAEWGCWQKTDKGRWIDRETGFVYEHRPLVRYRGFVKLMYDGDLVYILNIHEERFIAYHNWEIRADDRICTIGNKLYLRSNKDGKALRISKRSGDFQMFVVNKPIMAEDNEKRLLIIDAQMMIINKYGKEVETKQMTSK